MKNSVHLFKKCRGWRRLIAAVLIVAFMVPAFSPLASAVEEVDSFTFVPGVVPEEHELIYPDAPSVNFMSSGSYYDGRQYVSAVKNQGVNGLCWAFASLGAVEANLKKTREAIAKL